MPDSMLRSNPVAQPALPSPRVDRLAESLDAAADRMARHRRPIMLLCSLSVVVIGVADYYVDVAASMAIFYLAPVAVTTALMGFPAGAVMAVLAAATNFAGDWALFSRYPAVSNWTALWNAGSRLATYLIVASLITVVRHQLTRERERFRVAQEKMVEQARMRTMGELASGIAHDVNNTLVPVLGFTETLLEFPETLSNRARTRRILRTIRRATKDVADMVGRLRQFYRPGGADESLEAHDINRLAADAVWLTRHKWSNQAKAEGRKIAVSVEAGKVRPVVCSADEIREALVNLILNAVDALPCGGRVTLRTREDGGWCAVEVRDDGVGMTAEVRRRCLEPFFTTKGEGGSGLGLPMVAIIARRRGGSVDIRTKPGRGTTVTLRLPCVETSGRSVSERAAARWRRSLRILVVDDEPRALGMLAWHLRSDGHRVKAVSRGSEALAAFRRGRFDLLITDRGMPGMTGDELTHEIKRLKPAFPVMMVTGIEGPDARRGWAPADLVLRKPFSLSDLREGITRLVRSIRS
jgi:signal transduction histidine kinase/CheY-like chemotaxis protein